MRRACSPRLRGGHEDRAGTVVANCILRAGFSGPRGSGLYPDAGDGATVALRTVSRWLGKGLAGSLPSPAGRGAGWPALSPLPPGEGPPGEGLSLTAA